jgi:hypothetical protein
MASKPIACEKGTVKQRKDISLMATIALLSTDPNDNAQADLLLQHTSCAQDRVF